MTRATNLAATAPAFVHSRPRPALVADRPGPEREPVRHHAVTAVLRRQVSLADPPPELSSVGYFRRALTHPVQLSTLAVVSTLAIFLGGAAAAMAMAAYALAVAIVSGRDGFRAHVDETDAFLRRRERERRREERLVTAETRYRDELRRLSGLVADLEQGEWATVVAPLRLQEILDRYVESAFALSQLQESFRTISVEHLRAERDSIHVGDDALPADRIRRRALERRVQLWERRRCRLGELEREIAALAELVYLIHDQLSRSVSDEDVGELLQETFGDFERAAGALESVDAELETAAAG